MPSAFFGMNIAKSGMNAYNAALNTTGHNIANVKTPGYSRQEVVQRASKAISLGTSFGMIGSGVDAYGIESQRDKYYDEKFRNSNTYYGKYETASYYMEHIEDYIYAKDATSGSITNAFDKFTTALKGLTTSAADTTKRTQVGGFADSLAKYVSQSAKNLYALQEEVNTEIANTVNRINGYAQEIASLNKQIAAVEVYGARANDLRDQRATILDKLSELGSVDITEIEPTQGNGLAQFVVNFGGAVLVNTNEYNQILLETKETKYQQSDISHLYDLRWSTGQDFSIRDTELGGKLQTLFEMRDGNNGENFKATLQACNRDESTITLVTNERSSDNAKALAKLDIPEKDGVITINSTEYRYDSFDVSVDSNGNYTYTFKLTFGLREDQEASLNSQIADGKTDAAIGDSVSFRGIPYYMSQLNEFVRTFSANFNQVQNGGYDMLGNQGTDLFIGTDKVSGREYEMEEFLYNNTDRHYYLNGAKVLTEDEWNDWSSSSDYEFEPAVSATEQYYTVTKPDGEKERVFYPNPDPSAGSNPLFTFSSTVPDGAKASYYNITAMTFVAKDEIVRDGRLIACSARNPLTSSGTEENDNLAKFCALETDPTMFKQGKPAAFLQVMTSTLGVDSEKIYTSAESAEVIKNAVDNRRLSVAGVDEDEEGQNMIVCQNLLNIQYKVLSIMNEVLDKLINEMGV